MQIKAFGALAAASLSLSATSALAATAAPQAGIYSTTAYVDSVSLACFDQQGATYYGALTFPGLGASKYHYRTAISRPPTIIIDSVFVTAGGTQLAPSGTLNIKTNGTSTSKGTWSATITEVDVSSFLMHVTESYTTDAGTCNEVADITAILSGARPASGLL